MAKNTKFEIDANGNLFVTDEKNEGIGKVTQGGVVTTFAGSAQQGFNDGSGSAAQFYDPLGIAIDGSGNSFKTRFDEKAHFNMFKESDVIFNSISSKSGYDDHEGFLC